MAEQWYYTKGGQRCGPVTESQLQQLATSGQLQSADLVWNKSMANWVSASEAGVVPSAAVPSEPPPILQDEPPPLITAQRNEGNLPLSQKQLVLAYRIALGVAIFSLLLPWAKATGSASVATIPGLVEGGSSSMSVSVSGMSIFWGWIVLLAAIGGIYLSFIEPEKLLKDKTQLGMVGIGGLIVLLAIIGIARAGSQFGGSAQYANQYAQASRDAGAAFGVYLTLLAGIAIGVFGFMTDWNNKTAS